MADESDEVPAIPDVPDGTGASVTIGAAGCQEEIARPIRNRGGEYLWAVEGNRPTLEAPVPRAFEHAPASAFADVGVDGHTTIEGGHGRHEERYVAAISDPPGWPAEWPGVAAVVRVGSAREVKGANASGAVLVTTSRVGVARPRNGGPMFVGTGPWGTSCTGTWM